MQEWEYMIGVSLMVEVLPKEIDEIIEALERAWTLKLPPKDYSLHQYEMISCLKNFIKLITGSIKRSRDNSKIDIKLWADAFDSIASILKTDLELFASELTRDEAYKLDRLAKFSLAIAIRPEITHKSNKYFSRLKASTNYVIKTLETLEAESWLESLPTTTDNWLNDYPKAKASVEKGLTQASLGKVHRRSFIDMEFDD